MIRGYQIRNDQQKEVQGMFHGDQLKERSTKRGSRNDPQKEVQGMIHENRFKGRYTKKCSRNDTRKRFKECSTKAGVFNFLDDVFLQWNT
jgi:hypothetical protein